MNLSEPETRGWSQALREGLASRPVPGSVELAVFPPFPSIAEARAALAGLPVSLGGQNLHWEVSGAFTGEVSAHMLVDAGCRYALCGHSERRQIFGESDRRVGRKAAAARAGGLVPVLCVGETERQRDDGATLTVVEDQLRHGLGAPGPGWTSEQLVLAYEPVWAIGTGRTATPEQVAEVHRSLREALAALIGQKEADGTRILYGGSVKPSNAETLLGLDDVDGALIGGASLDATSFLGIARAA